jgi:hypothetical protein
MCVTIVTFITIVNYGYIYFHKYVRFFRMQIENHAVAYADMVAGWVCYLMVI